MVRYASVLALLGLAAVGCAGEVTSESPSEPVTESAADLTQGEEAENLKKIYAAAQADVDQVSVKLDESVLPPSKSPGGGARGAGFGLGGVDWFQKWPGGVSANHDYSKGSDAGKRCMWASVARFEAIMKDAPAEMVTFNERYDGWGGSFYNWNDDFAGKNAEGVGASSDARAPRLWAWRTGLTKWISQTAKDGTCLLPTRKMVIEYAAACASKLTEDPENPGKLKGEMQGCSR